MPRTKDMWDKFSIISSLSAVLVGLIGGIVFYAQQREIQITGIELVSKPSSEQRTKEVEKILFQINQIENKLTAIANVPKDQPFAPKIAEIETDIATLKENMDGINSVIMETPQKALQIPILRKDIEALRNELLVGMKSIEREVSRAYETIRWVIGTILFGILSLSASILFKGRKE